MNSKFAALTLAAATLHAGAETALPSGLAIRLAKTPDAKDADKPATLGYQRNDGGKHDYITQGAVKFDQDLGAALNTTLSPSLSWNHNTIAATPTDTWSIALGLKHKFPLSGSHGITLSESLSGQHDQAKLSTSKIAKVSGTWYGPIEWHRPGTNDHAFLRPTLTLFSKRVSSAAPDKITGIVPTGTFSGSVVSLDGEAQLGRWFFTAATQQMRPTSVVRGDMKQTHALHSVSITYQFYDLPTTEAEQKAFSGFMPGISLIRQVGDDPLNAVARAGFTQVVLSLKY